MSTIVEDIKAGQFSNIYLLCGAEAYQRKRYRDFLMDALCKDLDSMNVNRYEGKDINVAQVIDLAETMPFFADKRVILIENSGLFGSNGEKLAEYLNEPSGSTYFVFVEEEVDKRSKLYKTVSTKGKVEAYEILKDNDLKRWILTILKNENKQITENAYQLFVEKTGSDMNNMRTELEKLISYVGDRPGITPEDVEAICYTRINSKIFDLVEAIALKRQKQALEVYGDMLALKEPPMRILFLVAKQFNQLLMVRELRGKGLDKNSIATKIGAQEWLVRKYMDQASRFTTPGLKQAVNDCVKMEEDVKKGRISDTLAVEMIIIQYSR